MRVAFISIWISSVGTLRIFASNSWIFGVENCSMMLPNDTKNVQEKHNLWDFYHVKRFKISWFVTETCLVIGGILSLALLGISLSTRCGRLRNRSLWDGACFWNSLACWSTVFLAFLGCFLRSFYMIAWKLYEYGPRCQQKLNWRKKQPKGFGFICEFLLKMGFIFFFFFFPSRSGMNTNLNQN